MGRLQRDFAAARRMRLVSEYLLGGVVHGDEIARRLEEDGHLNPATNEPWSLATVYKDITDLKAIYHEIASANVETHYDMQLAELRRLKEHAWAKGNLALVLKCLEREARLTGTDKPLKQEHTGKDGAALFNPALTEEQAALLLAQIAGTKARIGEMKAGEGDACAGCGTTEQGSTS